MTIVDLVVFAMGFIIGVVITALIQRVKPTAGTLMIDHSDPDKDLYRFEVEDLDGLSNKKRISLDVDNNADLSQK